MVKRQLNSASNRKGTKRPPKLAAKSPEPGRRQRRATETRIRLFRCALALFAKRGFPNVTVEEITEAADVGKGTFFNYFDSKEHVLGVMGEIQIAKLAEARAMTAEGKLAIYDVLRHLSRRITEEPGRSPELARALISSFLASEAVREIVREAMASGRKMLAEIMDAGKRRGEIDRTLNSDELASQFLQTFLGTVLVWSLHEQPPLAGWIETAFMHLWRAIAAAHPESGRG